jgi:hypothetical protein
MQTTIFEMLDDVRHLCGWTTDDDLVECTEGSRN